MGCSELGIARCKRSRRSEPMNQERVAGKASFLYPARVFLMKVGSLAPATSPQCPKGLRGRGPSRELHACRRGAVRHPRGGEPPGEGLGSGTRGQALQSRAPTPRHHRSRWSVPHHLAGRFRPHCARDGTPTSAPELRRPHGQHVTGLNHVDFAREDVDLAIDGHLSQLNPPRFQLGKCPHLHGKSYFS